jgi:hypothetical protein
MLTVMFVLIIGALVCAIVSAVKPYPILWIAVVLLCIVEALSHLPSGAIR